MKWIMLLLAVSGNVVANIAFKYLARDSSISLNPHDWLQMLFRPSLWIGGVACLILVGSYLYAIKYMELGIVYAVVTSLALVFITILSMFLFDTTMTLTKVVGVGFVILGIALLVINTNESVSIT